jgi:signal transduction histidine kinase
MPARSAARAGLGGEKVRRWLPAGTPRWALPALLVAAGYYLAARIGFAFTLQPQPISTLWPPNALLLAALLLAPSRMWAALLLAALPAHLLAELQSGVPVAMVLGWYVSNCSEALIGAALIRAFVPGPLRLDSLRNVGLFLIGGALAAPLLSSFLDAALVRFVGWGESGYWELVRTRVFANFVAELTVAPLILAWASLGLARLRAAPPARYVEAALLFGGLIATSIALFDVPPLDPRAGPAIFYAPLPFLLWAAMRFPPAGTASTIAVITLASIWGAVNNLGPFADADPAATARELQLFLTVIAVPLLLLAVALEERRRVERDAQAQREQLTHLSRVSMLGQLSGGIVHELNQPLTAILSNAQAAQHFIANKNADPELLAEILQDIIVADQRAGEVIRRLHALFRRGEREFERLDAKELVQDVLRILHSDLVVRGVEIQADLREGLPPIDGDRVELQQVLLNLVMNACDAMRAVAEGKRGLYIRTRSVGADGVQISVRDSGEGFAAEEYQRLFDPFYSTKPQGLGLGLSICRAIVRAHRGRLWGTSVAGKGATFHVLLPARRAAMGP